MPWQTLDNRCPENEKFEDIKLVGELLEPWELTELDFDREEEPALVAS